MISSDISMRYNMYLSVCRDVLQYEKKILLERIIEYNKLKLIITYFTFLLLHLNQILR